MSRIGCRQPDLVYLKRKLKEMEERIKSLVQNTRGGDAKSSREDRMA
ncbi:MAG: hypothetical protein QXO38_06100 [Candidatus Nezhaarchaeales archaeon]